MSKTRSGGGWYEPWNKHGQRLYFVNFIVMWTTYVQIDALEPRFDSSSLGKQQPFLSLLLCQSLV
jgi:hypothetical protein